MHWRQGTPYPGPALCQRSIGHSGGHSGIQASAILDSDRVAPSPQARAPAVRFLLALVERRRARELQSATPSLRALQSTVLGFATLAASWISIAVPSTW